MKRLLVSAFLCLFVIATSVWAGENKDATLSFDLELKAAVQAGDQGEKPYSYKMGVGPDVSVILSIYGNGLSNLTAYTIELKFEADKVDFGSGSYLRPAPLELDVFTGGGSATPVAAIENTVGLGSFLPSPTAETAPDGDGKLLAWIEFKTKGDFTTDTPAEFSLLKGELKGVDGIVDEVAVKPKAYLNSTSVEPSLWGQIKALFK